MRSLKESDLSLMWPTNMKKAKKLRPYREATDSEKGWVYGAGIELVFKITTI